MVDCLKESHLVITHGPFCVLGGQQVRVDFVIYLQRCLVQKGTCHLSMVGKQMGETRSVLRACLRSKNNLANQRYTNRLQPERMKEFRRDAHSLLQ